MKPISLIKEDGVFYPPKIDADTFKNAYSNYCDQSVSNSVEITEDPLKYLIENSDVINVPTEDIIMGLL